MSMVGMSVDEVRGLATQLSHAASEIHTLQAQLTATLQSTTWVGNDRNQFESNWTSTHVTALNNVVNELNHAAQAANRNADDQDQVSNSL